MTALKFFFDWRKTKFIILKCLQYFSEKLERKNIILFAPYLRAKKYFIRMSTCRQQHNQI